MFRVDALKAQLWPMPSKTFFGGFGFRAVPSNFVRHDHELWLWLQVLISGPLISAIILQLKDSKWLLGSFFTGCGALQRNCQSTPDVSRQQFDPFFAQQRQSICLIQCSLHECPSPLGIHCNSSIGLLREVSMVRIWVALWAARKKGNEPYLEHCEAFEMINCLR